jgi:hypothetical protein
MANNEQLHFCIGRYVRKQIATFRRYGTDIHPGTMEDAEKLLAYVKEKYPAPKSSEWQIFRVEPIPLKTVLKWCSEKDMNAH